jgi:hypothetical protein
VGDIAAALSWVLHATMEDELTVLLGTRRKKRTIRRLDQPNRRWLTTVPPDRAGNRFEACQPSPGCPESSHSRAS